ncbi:MAG: transketolase [Bacteroidetes bacterium MED-G17]|nr:MAG: transketolase [Bacteroidetes bacterium MED-G17]|tara:strand:- start:2003 stop:4369 length:2367 start_codon:yes stop_codon:yes gene_type:complete
MGKAKDNKAINQDSFKQELLEDYRVAYRSRHASLLGRKEVLTGKAKFGIFGDGKEIAQVAMAKFFEKGDYRAGYYRDQTFMFAKGISDVQKFFAQLYAHPDVHQEPSSGGRSMNGHFSTRLLDENGDWLNPLDRFNSSADISPTAGQMPRLLGLAFASKIYRQHPKIKQDFFSNNGNEIAWGTIGNASTSEGHFWETINAAGVLQVPMLLSIWDDGYGISVPAKYQTTKEDIGALLEGFVSDKEGEGIHLFRVAGWDYPNLVRTYKEAVELCRSQHKPVVVHVTEMTQPQGHSTSGSHERYKSKERLKWEEDFDCIQKMRQWILDKNVTTEDKLELLEKEEIEGVKNSKKVAWDAFNKELKNEVNLIAEVLNKEGFSILNKELKSTLNPLRRDLHKLLHKAILEKNSPALVALRDKLLSKTQEKYSSHLYSHSKNSIGHISPTPFTYEKDAKQVNGFEILQAFFDYQLTNNPKFFAFGEDVGKIGDVNQGFAGLQEKHGEHRVTDTGIREMTIVGQAIGAAMRGLRPLAEIQYLDYLLYGIQTLSDDVSTLQYRSAGGQKAPLIIRTRGHRLEGIWHSGSPMGMVVNALRGMHVCVPRNMTQAVGMYNTLLQSDEPALVVECLNGYRLKEKMPNNLGQASLPLGMPEILETGNDITVVSYGSTLRIIQEALPALKQKGIGIELIDVQTLLPFDIQNSVVDSIKKTNKVAFIDEDVSGGATAFMMEKVLVNGGGFQFLDAQPICISAKDHRPAYGTDGDYFSKPNAEEIFDKLYNMMNEYNPQKYPNIF